DLKYRGIYRCYRYSVPSGRLFIKPEFIDHPPSIILHPSSSIHHPPSTYRPFGTYNIADIPMLQIFRPCGTALYQARIYRSSTIDHPPSIILHPPSTIHAPSIRDLKFEGYPDATDIPSLRDGSLSSQNLSIIHHRSSSIHHPPSIIHHPSSTIHL